MYMIMKNVKNSKLDSKNSSPTLTLSAPEKSKHSIFEIPIIPQNLSITTSESQVQSQLICISLENLLNTF